MPEPTMTSIFESQLYPQSPSHTVYGSKRLYPTSSVEPGTFCTITIILDYTARSMQPRDELTLPHYPIWTHCDL